MNGQGREVSQITGIVNRGMAAPLIEALAVQGISDGHLAAGRAAVLEERRRLLGGERQVLAEDPVEILSFLVEPDCAEGVLRLLIQTARMEIRGRGMAWRETVTLLAAHALCPVNRPACLATDLALPLLTDLVGICCIVQRGQGDAIARVALDTGTCVPAVTFGHGTGVRDKLGLLRIAIPAEKEMIRIVSDRENAPTVMDLMIDVGRLDQPGKGFIYAFPIDGGIVNTKITRGMVRHAASIEQIVSAIDELKGGTTWRRRSGTADRGSRDTVYLTDLVDLTLVCDEGRGEDLVKVAMEVGAAGATISRKQLVRSAQSHRSAVSPARECCNMIVGQAQVAAIGEALTQAGAFGDGSHGFLYSRRVPRAFTYLGRG